MTGRHPDCPMCRCADCPHCMAVMTVRISYAPDASLPVETWVCRGCGFERPVPKATWPPRDA